MNANYDCHDREKDFKMMECITNDACKKDCNTFLSTLLRKELILC